MNKPARFTVLIESRALPRWSIAGLGLIALAIAAIGLRPAHAQSITAAEARASHKIARDLAAGIDAPVPPRINWLQDRGGQRTVEAIVMSRGGDSVLTGLRSQVEKLGGRALRRHDSIGALTVELPARAVRQLAARDDVIHISPNRPTRPMYSTLERITGAITPSVRPTSTRTNYTGYDGRDIGIAIVDSGIQRSHKTFIDRYNNMRIFGQVTMIGTSVSKKYGSIFAMQPGSRDQLSYQSSINNAGATTNDAYG
ncbi:MAG: hypothetical protein OEV65_18035, partial [Aquincola sp.]|nr:hypothetical protein [Aquincola sp.]